MTHPLLISACIAGTLLITSASMTVLGYLISWNSEQNTKLYIVGKIITFWGLLILLACSIVVGITLLILSVPPLFL